MPEFLLEPQSSAHFSNLRSLDSLSVNLGINGTPSIIGAPFKGLCPYNDLIEPSLFYSCTTNA